jgi:hypothetical protein
VSDRLESRFDPARGASPIVLVTCHYLPNFSQEDLAVMEIEQQGERIERHAAQRARHRQAQVCASCRPRL